MKKEITLVERLERYLKAHPGEYICGGTLQKLAADKGYEPSNCARRLRELTNDGILEVQYIKGQNKIPVAWYRYKPKHVITSSYQIIDGKAIEVKQRTLA